MGFLINPYNFGIVPSFSDNGSLWIDQTDADSLWARSDTVNNYLRANYTNKNVDFNIKRDASNDAIVRALGLSVSNTIWLLRYKTTSTSYTAGNDISSFWCLSNSDQTVAGDAAQDSIGYVVSGTGTNNDVGSFDTDGTSPTSAGSENTVTQAFTATNPYAFTVARLTATTCQTKIFSDNYITTLQTINGTPLSTTTGLNKFKIMNRGAGAANTGAGVYIGTLDDLEVYDGRSSV